MSEPKKRTLAELGALLRQTRELKGLNLKQLSAELRLLEFHVTEMESGEYSHIKSAVFAKGYIRKYAERLGLDTAQIMEWFDQSSDELQREEPFRRRLPANKWPAGTGVAIAVVVLLALGAGIWFAAELLTGSDQRVVETIPVSSVAELQAAAGAVAVNGPDDVLELPLAGDNSDGQSVEMSMASAAAVVNTDNSAVLPDPATPIAQSAELELRFSGDCWVEVRDSKGILLVADLKKKGDVVSLQGEAPFEMKLGDVMAVEVSYLGRQIPVVPEQGKKTAQLIIGE